MAFFEERTIKGRSSTVSESNFIFHSSIVIADTTTDKDSNSINHLCSYYSTAVSKKQESGVQGLLLFLWLTVTMWVDYCYFESQQPLLLPTPRPG